MSDNFKTKKTENKSKKDAFSNFLELRNNIIRESLDDINSTNHRLEFIRNLDGVDYVNDSKATNVDLAWYSLETMTAPVVWIVGGVDDASDYSMLKEIVSDKVKAIICLGKNCHKIFKTFMSEVDLIIASESADEAAQTAKSISKNGDTVLLSPGCASFDLFESYEDRGNKFRDAVNKLSKN